MYTRDAALDPWIASHNYPAQTRVRVSTSYWRYRARQVINDVLTTTLNLSPEERLRAIDRAYPFGAREQWPYKCWLRERHLAMVDLGLRGQVVPLHESSDPKEVSVVAHGP